MPFKINCETDVTTYLYNSYRHWKGLRSGRRQLSGFRSHCLKKRLLSGGGYFRDSTVYCMGKNTALTAFAIDR